MIYKERYQMILVDPPWTYRDKGAAGNRGASQKYACLTQRDLSRLPVEEIAAENCLLAMWWVAPMPREALDLVSAWGFKLSTMKGFTWAKETKNKRVHWGLGHWTRSNTEDVLFARRGRPERQSAAVSQLVTSRVLHHSRKPAEVREDLVTLMGDIPRIELFATERVPGWDALGLDLDGKDIRDSLPALIGRLKTGG